MVVREALRPTSADVLCASWCLGNVSVHGSLLSLSGPAQSAERHSGGVSGRTRCPDKAHLAANYCLYCTAWTPVHREAPKAPEPAPPSMARPDVGCDRGAWRSLSDPAPRSVGDAGALGEAAAACSCDGHRRAGRDRGVTPGPEGQTCDAAVVVSARVDGARHAGDDTSCVEVGDPAGLDRPLAYRDAGKRKPPGPVPPDVRSQARALMCSATRSAFAAIVSAGFITGRDGKNEASTTYRFSTSWARHVGSRTLFAGSSPARTVPAW
jgi:hypothetical protein